MNDNELIEEIADKHKLDPELLRRLIAFEVPKIHLERRRGAKDGIRRILEEWIEKEKIEEIP